MKSQISNPVYILTGARTPFAAWASGKTGAGQAGGALKPYDPFDLGAAALKGALEKSGLEPQRLDRVVFGNMYHVGAHACYGGRYVALRAGVPPEIPALTTNMACGAGLHAVLEAAQDVAGGEAALIAAAGADNISLVPRREIFVPSFKDLGCGRAISKTADELAGEFNISREAQDQWALRSHARAGLARRQGRLGDEITPVGATTQDDNMLDEPNLNYFAQSRPFGDIGSVTPANTHGLVDGGSALILADEKTTHAWGKKPLGRILAGAFAATTPERMAWASVPAIRAALKRAGLTIEQIDLFEINETFAAQTLIDIRELDIPEDKVNVNGGSIALGHPFGGTGGRLVLGLLLELGRRGLKRGAASICVGGGQGVAIVVERA
ncbi:MAG: thiolase family protein [Elusimicrobia bacterium]|nr:thiolase family protein [Elusimicrobiota bacterium]